MKFGEIARAQKRARHFGLLVNRKKLAGTSEAEIATRNYGWLCSHPVDAGMVVLLDSWARNLNKVADSERVMDNPVTRWCFGRFAAACDRVADFEALS